MPAYDRGLFPAFYGATPSLKIENSNREIVISGVSGALSISQGTASLQTISGSTVGNSTDQLPLSIGQTFVNEGVGTLGNFRLYEANLEMTPVVLTDVIGPSGSYFLYPPATEDAWTPVASVKGRVKDYLGNPAQRVVRAYQRSDGKLIGETLSDPATGEFTILTRNQSKHYVVVTDNQAWETYFAFDGINGSTSIEDMGGKLVTVVAPVQVSTAQSVYGGASLLFSGGYLLMDNHPDLYLSTVDFTIETWIRLTSGGSEMGIFDTRISDGGQGAYFFVNSSRQPAFRAAGTTIVTAGTQLALDTWYHVAITRSSGVFRAYVNGVLDSAEVSFNINLRCEATARVGGSYVNPASDLMGYLDDFRLSKGFARYKTTAFSVPANAHFAQSEGDPHWTSVVLASQFNGRRWNGDPYQNSVVLNMRMNGSNDSTSIIDDAGKTPSVFGSARLITSQKKFGTASAYFNGAGSYITLPASSDWAFGNGNFTIEAWVYIDSIPPAGKYPSIIASRLNNSAMAWTAFLNGDDGRVYIGVSSNGSTPIYAASSSTSDISQMQNKWTHLAFVRSGSSIRVYVDGVGGNANTAIGSSSLYTYSGETIIGRIEPGNASHDFAGYIDDLRVTKGVARYTGNFTPATSEIPALLATDWDTSGNRVATNTGVTFSSAQKKFGEQSAYFNGSSYLTYAASSDWNFGTGDFTIEFWRYLLNHGTGGYSHYFNINTSNQEIFTLKSWASATYLYKSGLTLISDDTAPLLNTWEHVALTRSGTSLRIFVNGNLCATVDIGTTSFGSSTASAYIGKAPGVNEYTNGYIDDMRITKGVARYTANFTPPSEPFKTQQQTYSRNNALIYDYITPVK